MTAAVVGGTRPVGYRRLIDVHLRIWLSSPAILSTALIALLLGAATLLLEIALHEGGFTVAGTRQLAESAETAFGLFWPVLGAAAAASAFSSRWAGVVLVVAPRRGRWLVASLASFLLMAAAVAVGFVLIAGLVTALAGAGFDPARAVLGRMGAVVAATLLRVTVGFLLGAALRNGPVAIVILLVVPVLLRTLTVGSVDVGGWLNLDNVIGAGPGTPGPHHLLPIVTALLVWVAAPAVGAWTRLKSSIG